MTRLITAGAELRSVLSTVLNAAQSGDGDYITAAAPTIDAANGRLGLGAAYKCGPVATAANGVGPEWRWTGALSRNYYLRAYVNFNAFPTTTNNLMTMFPNASGGTSASARIDSGGVLRLWNNNGAAQIGAGTITLVTGRWYRIELRVFYASGAADDQAELLVDGVQIAVGTGLSIATTAPDTANCGYIDGVGNTTSFCLVDDVAVNDDQGTVQNSWPGEGKQVILLPASDNARAGWVAGTATTTGLWDAVNNTPPVGVAQASGTAASQIEDSTNNATDNYDANLQTYAVGGVSGAVTVVQPVVNVGTSTAVLANIGVSMVSNPAIAEVNAATVALIAGTFPTNWQWGRGTVTYNPAVTPGTAPVMRVGKRTASTAFSMVDFMGLYVEFVPAPSRRPVGKQGASAAVVHAAVR